MGSTYARLTRGFSFAILGQLAIYAVSFLIAPIYARSLRPDEYGVISLTNSVRSVLIMLMPMGVTGAVSYWYNLHRTQPGTLRRTMGGIAGLGFAASLFWLAVGLGAGAHLQYRFMPGFPLPFWPSGAFVVGSAWLLSLQSIPMALLATRERQDRVALISLALGFSQVAWVLLMVVILHRAAAGQIEAMFLYALAATPFFVGMLWRDAPLRFDPSLWWAAARYSFPLLPHQLAVWGLNLSDRLIIGHYGQRFAYDLGLYSFAYTVASLMQVVVSGLSSIWSPVFLEQARSNPKAPLVLGQTAAWCCLGLSLAASGLILFAPWLVALIGSARYRGSTHFIAPVVLGYFMQGIYLFPSIGLFHVRRTGRLPVITLCSSALNIGLNLALIPRYGVTVAAWSTAAGFTLMAVLGFLLGHPAYPLRYPWRPMMLSALILVTCIALSIAPGRSPGMLALKAGLWGLAVGLSYLAWRRIRKTTGAERLLLSGSLRG
jgi:O-antigen/teichoic acid export membrane protein